MTLHTYNPQAMSLQSTNFLHFVVSDILPSQTFSAPANPAPWVKTVCNKRGMKDTGNSERVFNKGRLTNSPAADLKVGEAQKWRIRVQM